MIFMMDVLKHYSTDSPTPDSYSCLWSVVVVITFALQATVHALAVAVLPIENSIVGIIQQYPTLLSADQATYLVWGVLYAFQLAFCMYQICPCLQNSQEGLRKGRVYATTMFVLQSIWVLLFLHQLFFTSFFVVVAILVCAALLYYSLDINYTFLKTTVDCETVCPRQCYEQVYHTNNIVLPAWHAKLFLFTPVSLTLSWTLYSLCSNFLTCLSSTGWGTTISSGVGSPSQAHNASDTVATPSIFGVSTMTVTTDFQTASVAPMVVAANQDLSLCFLVAYTVSVVYLAFRYNDVPACCVGIWVLCGIVRGLSADWLSQVAIYMDVSLVYNAALMGIIILMVTLLIAVLKTITENIYACKIQRSVETAAD